MKLIVHLKTPDLAQRVNLAIRLRWPDAAISSVDKEDSLVDAAPRADVIFLDEPATRPAGFELIRRIRAVFDGALIVLGPEPNDEKMLNVLEAGADDYFAASFGPAQVVARLSAILRRVPATAPRDHPIARYGSLEINKDTHETYLLGRELSVTSTEFVLLWELSTARGGLATKQSLHRLISPFPDSLADDSLRKHVQRLRSKLRGAGDGSVEILNVRGIGYRLRYSE